MLLAYLSGCESYVNSAGIVLSSLGAYLVWQYLTDINFADKKAYLLGKGVLTVPNPSLKDIRRLKRSILFSKMGLCMILFGGALQILSNHISS